MQIASHLTFLSPTPASPPQLPQLSKRPRAQGRTPEAAHCRALQPKALLLQSGAWGWWWQREWLRLARGRVVCWLSTGGRGGPGVLGRCGRIPPGSFVPAVVRRLLGLAACRYVLFFSCAFCGVHDKWCTPRLHFVPSTKCAFDTNMGCAGCACYDTPVTLTRQVSASMSRGALE
jgi:hypothetical protein